MKKIILPAALALILLWACGGSSQYYKQLFALGKQLQTTTAQLQSDREQAFYKIEAATDMRPYEFLPIYELCKNADTTLSNGNRQFAELYWLLIAAAQDPNKPASGNLGSGNIFTGLEALPNHKDKSSVKRIFMEEGAADKIAQSLQKQKAALSELFNVLINATSSEVDSLKNQLAAISAGAELFQNANIAEAALILATLQHQIENSATQIFSLVGSDADKKTAFQTKPILATFPLKNHIRLGETYHTKIAILELPDPKNSTKLEFSIGGKPIALDSNGVAVWSQKAQKLGINSYMVDLKITNPYTGETISFKKRFEYEAIQR